MCSFLYLAGCNPGITEPEPNVMKNIQEYFWNNTGSSSLIYEYYNTNDLSRKEFEYTFSRLNGINTTTTVSEIPPISQRTFYFKIDSTGSIAAGGLSYHTLFPLPEGYEIEPKLLHTESDTIKYGTKKVLALRNNYAIAIRSDDSVFYSTNNGLSWEKSLYRGEFGTITAWTRVVLNNEHVVYAGTSSGACLVTKDGGNTWKQIKQVANAPITSIAGTSSGVLFLSSGTKFVYRIEVDNVASATKQTYPSEITYLAACEVYLDAGTAYPVFMIGTKQKGLFYWIEGKSQSITIAKGGSAAPTISSIVPTGRSSAVALGTTESSKLALLYSTDAGLTWEQSDIPDVRGMFLDATPSVTISNLLIADEAGNVYLGSSQQGARPVFNTIKPSDIRNPIKDISISEEAIIATSDSSGVFISTDKGISWQNATKGLWRINTSIRKTDGMLTLLPRLDKGVTKGDEWLAGYVLPAGAVTPMSIGIHATVIEHYSRLELPFSAGSYEDVYEVTYMCAPNGRETHTVHVFYAKDFGPILFQRYIGEELIDESYIKSK